jgi:hypothetical protein
VIAAVPVFVSLVAEIVVDPTATAVNCPEVGSTDATLGCALDHVTTRPVSTLLLASRVTAESCAVPPTWRLDDAGETDTDATATGVVVVTERVATPVAPSLEAVI